MHTICYTSKTLQILNLQIAHKGYKSSIFGTKVPYLNCMIFNLSNNDIMKNYQTRRMLRYAPRFHGKKLSKKIIRKFFFWLSWTNST
jgi:hypothetical protein